MTRVVIDPGVLVSAFISSRKAAPALLVDAFLDGHFEMVVSPWLISELTDVLAREKFAAHAADGRAAALSRSYATARRWGRTLRPVL